MSEHAQLIDRLTAYGADMPGINARFMGDYDLYVTCLSMLLSDGAFATLGEALRAGDAKRAFEAAHSLKGVIGNMGLTPLYRLVCVLVEEVRADRTDGLMPQYDAVMDNLQLVKDMV